MVTIDLEPGTRNTKSATAQMAGKSPNPFSKFGPALEREVRKEIVTGDQRLEAIMKAFERLSGTGNVIARVASDAKAAFREEAKQLAVTPNELQLFVCTLAERYMSLVNGRSTEAKTKFALCSSYFISELINEGPEEEYRIPTAALGISLPDLGYRNKKTIIIDGPAGDRVGNGMLSGRIIVNGDAGDSAGIGLFGGEIEIRGNAGNNLADLMAGGTVIVRRNAGSDAASKLVNGRVIIEGDAGSGAARNLGLGTVHIKGNVLGNAGEGMKRGTLIIEGDVQGSFCEGMCGGNAQVKGNVRGDVGRKMNHDLLRSLFQECEVTIWRDVLGNVGEGMKGGSIIIHGNAYSRTYVGRTTGNFTVSRVAKSMTGGRIRILGSGGSMAAHHMRGGELYLDGGALSVSNERFGGAVYVRGRLFAKI